MTQRQLLGNRFDDHDWMKIANIDFDGSRKAEDIKRVWQNSEHPSINKAQWSSEDMQQLIKIAERAGCVDWEWIASELQTNRTAFMCLQKYQELNKDLKKSEWTKEEDQMLTELVQKMRVGNFIPYTKIAYFMEGRNGSQILYRWSKSLDPTLKKGPWSPAEDALLLKAVAKYGSRDWFKIQEEVPGRIDAQCRDRYRNGLNQNVRKGKWTAKEESHLKALIEKHGVGKWAKIARELSGRTDTQCLSKWKVMAGLKNQKAKGNSQQGTRKRKRRRQIAKSKRWESSSTEGSEDMEDEKILEEMEQEQEEAEEHEEVQKVERKKCRVKHKNPTETVVLDVDQWVPIVENKQPPEKNTNCQHEKTAMQRPVDNWEIESQNQRGRPKSSKIWRKFPKPSSAIPSVGETGVGPEEGVSSTLTVMSEPDPPPKTAHCLVANDAQLEHPQSQRDPKRARRRIPAANLSERSLDRKLLAEISRWTTARPVVRREIDILRERLEATGLSSTPVFILLLQVFRIDKEGCMQIIKDKMSKAAQSLPAINKSENESRLGPYLNQVKGATIDVGNGQTMEMSRFKLSSAPLREKPKTVLELLAEKRRARGLAKRSGNVPKPLVFPRPLIIQQPLQVKILPQPAASSKVPVGPEPQASEQSCTSSIQTRSRTKPATKSTVGQTVHKPVAGTQELLSGQSKGAGEPGMTPSQHSSQMAVVKPMKKFDPAPALNAPSAQPAAAICRGKRLQPIAPAPPTLPVLQPNSLVIPLMLPNSTVPIMALVTPQGLLCIPPGTVMGVPNQNAQVPATVTVVSQTSPTVVTTVPLNRASTSTSSSTATQVLVNSPFAPSESETGGPSVASVQTISSTQLSSTQPLNSPSLAVCKLIPPAFSSAQIQQTCTPMPANCGTLAPTLTSTSTTALSADLPAVKAIKQVAADHIDLNVPAPPTTMHLAQGPGCSRMTADIISTGSPCPQPSSWAQPEGSKLPSARLQLDKASVDFKLLSDDKDAVMKDWLEGEGGVRVPGTQITLPYLPPFASTLRAFSNLLLHKKVLEQNLPAFESANVNEPIDPKKRLEAARVLVSECLQNNPGYQLLKARFLSAFTLPAFLATLPPQGTLTTIGSSTGGLNQDSTEESEYTETDMENEEGTEGLPEHSITDEVTNRELNQPFEISADLSFGCDLPDSLETIVGDQSTPEPPNAPEASSVLEGEIQVPTRQSHRLRKNP